MVVLRVIKAAQRLGFTLEEVADLLHAGRHRHGSRTDAGLQSRAKAKLAEADSPAGTTTSSTRTRGGASQPGGRRDDAAYFDSFRAVLGQTALSQGDTALSRAQQ